MSNNNNIRRQFLEQLCDTTSCNDNTQESIYYGGLSANNTAQDGYVDMIQRQFWDAIHNDDKSQGDGRNSPHQDNSQCPTVEVKTTELESERSCSRVTASVVAAVTPVDRTRAAVKPSSQESDYFQAVVDELRNAEKNSLGTSLDQQHQGEQSKVESSEYSNENDPNEMHCESPPTVDTSTIVVDGSHKMEETLLLMSGTLSVKEHPRVQLREESVDATSADPHEINGEFPQTLHVSTAVIKDETKPDVVSMSQISTKGTTKQETRAPVKRQKLSSPRLLEEAKRPEVLQSGLEESQTVQDRNACLQVTLQDVDSVADSEIPNKQEGEVFEQQDMSSQLGVTFQSPSDDECETDVFGVSLLTEPSFLAHSVPNDSSSYVLENAASGVASCDWTEQDNDDDSTSASERSVNLLGGCPSSQRDETGNELFREKLLPKLDDSTASLDIPVQSQFDAACESNQVTTSPCEIRSRPIETSRDCEKHKTAVIEEAASSTSNEECVDLPSDGDPSLRESVAVATLAGESTCEPDEVSKFVSDEEEMLQVQASCDKPGGSFQTSSPRNNPVSSTIATTPIRKRKSLDNHKDSDTAKLKSKKRLKITRHKSGGWITTRSSLDKRPSTAPSHGRVGSMAPQSSTKPSVPLKGRVKDSEKRAASGATKEPPDAKSDYTSSSPRCRPLGVVSACTTTYSLVYSPQRTGTNQVAATNFLNKKGHDIKKRLPPEIVKIAKPVARKSKPKVSTRFRPIAKAADKRLTQRTLRDMFG